MNENRTLIYTKKMPILWDDMDGYGHVNNAKYFTYMQECRIDWLLQAGISLDPQSIGPVLGSTSCKFIRPIVFPATINIEMYFIGKVGKKLVFEHVITDANNPERVYAIGEAVVIWFDFVNNSSIELPEHYHHLLPEQV